MSCKTVLKAKAACLTILLLGSMALAAALFIPQPAYAAELCWSTFIGYKCHPCALPPPPDLECAKYCVNGNCGPCVYVEEGSCATSCGF